jgi:hypothetical protein
LGTVHARAALPGDPHEVRSGAEGECVESNLLPLFGLRKQDLAVTPVGPPEGMTCTVTVGGTETGGTTTGMPGSGRVGS